MFDKLRDEVIGKKKTNGTKGGVNMPECAKGATYMSIKDMIDMPGGLLIGAGFKNVPEVGVGGKIVQSETTGEAFVKPVVYLTFTLDGGIFFTMTNSNLLVKQIEAMTGTRLYESGEGVFDIELGIYQNKMFTIGTEYVTYRNGLEYEIPVMRDVTE